MDKWCSEKFSFDKWDIWVYTHFAKFPKMSVHPKVSLIKWDFSTKYWSSKLGVSVFWRPSKKGAPLPRIPKTLIFWWDPVVFWDLPKNWKHDVLVTYFFGENREICWFGISQKTTCFLGTISKNSMILPKNPGSASQKTDRF